VANAPVANGGPHYNRIGGRAHSEVSVRRTTILREGGGIGLDAVTTRPKNRLVVTQRQTGLMVSRYSNVLLTWTLMLGTTLAGVVPVRGTCATSKCADSAGICRGACCAPSTDAAPACCSAPAKVRPCCCSRQDGRTTTPPERKGPDDRRDAPRLDGGSGVAATSAAGERGPRVADAEMPQPLATLRRQATLCRWLI